MKLAEKNPDSFKTKKAVSKKVIEEPISKKKIVTVKNVSKKNVPIVKKKPEKKVVSKETKIEVIPLQKNEEIGKKPATPAVLTKEKVASEKQKSKPKVTPIKDKKVAKPEAPSIEKKDLKNKVEANVPKQKRKSWTGNPMLIPKIEKITVNMSVGKSGAPLQQAVTILKQLTDQEPSRRAAKKTIREFGIRKGESIACLVTIRDEKAEEFLRKAFYALENKLSKYNFDRQGNFSFAIKEHIDLPGTKYAPELGIHGMDVSVSLGRPGFRVKRRHRARTKIGKDHQLTADEAILFIKDEFDVEIT